MLSYLRCRIFLYFVYTWVSLGFFVTSEQLSSISFVQRLQVTRSYLMNFFLPLQLTHWAQAGCPSWCTRTSTASCAAYWPGSPSSCGWQAGVQTLRRSSATLRLCRKTRRNFAMSLLGTASTFHLLWQLPPLLRIRSRLSDLIFFFLYVFSKSIVNARTPCSTRGWNFLFISGSSESSLSVELHLLMLQ